MAVSFLGQVAASVRKRFIDTFTRTNTSGSLGTATDGSSWNATKGTFTVDTNKAKAATTDYQIATQSMPYSNVDLSIKSVTQGTGAALWVTDSGNWWAVGTDTGAGESCNCQTCSNASYDPGYYYAGNTNYVYSCQTCSSYGCSTCYNAYTCQTCYNASNAIYYYQSSNGACMMQ
jgi:hypothetical protein